jgi:rubrerythrin
MDYHWTEENMEELTVEEIIRCILLAEQESFQFYRKASKFLEGNELKSFIDELSDQEREHIRRLKVLLNEETLPTEDLTPLVYVDTSIFEGIIQTQNIPVQAKPLDIMNLSLKREVNTLKSFKLLAPIPVLNKKIKQVLSELIDLEEGHVERIREMIEKFRR